MSYYLDSHAPSGEEPGHQRISIFIRLWHCTYIPLKLSQKPQKTWIVLFFPPRPTVLTDKELFTPSSLLYYKGRAKQKPGFNLKNKLLCLNTQILGLVSPYPKESCGGNYFDTNTVRRLNELQPVKNRTVIIPHSGSCWGWGESRGGVEVAAW